MNAQDIESILGIILGIAIGLASQWVWIHTRKERS